MTPGTSPPISSVHGGILQAGILEWVAMPFSRGSSPPPGIEPETLISPALAGGFFTTSATRKPLGLIIYIQLIYSIEI